MDLGREPKRLWDMRVTVIIIIVGTLGKVPKSLEKLGNWRGRIEIIQTTAQLK